MQRDGDFVVSKNPGGPIWSSKTFVGTDLGWDRYIILQSDCNLVMYQAILDKTLKWDTKTTKPSNICYPKLVMQNDGNLVLLDTWDNNKLLW